MKTEAVKRNNSKVGDKVICNGYPGTVTRLYYGMVEVRLSRGTVCVTDNPPDVIPVERGK